MKALLGIILTIVVNCSYASVTYQQAQKVFVKLKAASGINSMLWLNNSNDVNAYANWSGVHINKGMLRFLDDENQLASVLGHELGHLKYNDHWHSHNKDMELRADRYGFELSGIAGYNKCAGIQYLYKFYKVFGDDPSKTHPNNSVRYKAFRGSCHR